MGESEVKLEPSSSGEIPSGSCGASNACGDWSLAADLLRRDVMIGFEYEHFQNILVSKGKAFRFSSIPSWGKNSEIAADTCCKEATEEGTPDSTSCQRSSSDPVLATHLCGLQRDVEVLHTSGPARLWRSPSRACPCSSSCT